MDMKKLYALLIILIVIYVGINVSVNGFSILNVSDNQANANNNDAKAVDFPSLNNFSKTKINDTAVRYTDNNTGINIEVQKINNSTNISSIYNSSANGDKYTSSQQINQNGVTAYFLYNEGASTYNTDIYFNKHDQNYKISGYNTTYENSDYFISQCKQIIDTI